MRLLLKSMVALAAAVLLPATMCWAHGSNIVQIQVGVDGGNLSILNGADVSGLKVIADHTEVIPSSGSTIVPGWSIDAALQSSTLRLRVVDELMFWDTTSGLAATTSETLHLQREYFSVFDEAVVSQAAITDAETLVWDTNTVGQSHHIMRYEVSASAPNGAYGVLLQVEDVSSTLGNTAPFLLVLNKGLTTTPDANHAGQPLDGSELGQALTDMSGAVVPEPATLGLVLSMGLCLAPWGWYRRRRRRNQHELN